MKFYESSLFYIAVALLLIAPFSGFAVVLLASMGVFVFWIDLLLRAVVHDRRKLRIAQWMVVPATILFFFAPRLLPLTDHSVQLKVKLPAGFVGEVSIIAGVPNTPPLSSDTATIEIPMHGLFVTSTQIGEKEELETNLSQQHLPFFLLSSPTTFHRCGGYKSISYRVSNVDSIRFVPDTFIHARCNIYYDSLVRACIESRY